MSLTQIEAQARLLAHENRLGEPAIRQIIWFPDQTEVRLIETLDDIPTSDAEVTAMYFRANEREGLPYPSHIGLIRPEEVGRLTLPERWGDWSDGHEL